MACNGEDRDLSQGDTPPEEIIKSYEHLIAQDLKRIEEQGGEHADQLKASLYEKWVPELLDTISMLCKTTSELEQVSSNAVIQLDHKLQETASATRNFMHRSAELEENYLENCGYSVENNATNEMVRSLQSSFQHMCSQQDNHSSADAEGNSLLPLQTQLMQTQQALAECQARCQTFERTIKRLEGELKELQDKLIKREKQIDDLLRNQEISQPTMEDEEKSRLEQLIMEKDAELQKVVAQKRLFEKRACDREDKIKALTMEVASKHDVACQLEDRLKQAQQRDDKHQMQLNYQSMLLDALRKELRKYKKDKTTGADEKTAKDVPNSSQATQAESNILSGGEKESCQAQPDNNKSKEFVHLERRLEELEMMLRAKNEMISKMSMEATPSRSQPRTVAIHQMSPEELKTTLLSKEKEIEEQRQLIGQLQDALVASKHKLEELQKSSGDGVSDTQKDEVIRSLQKDLAEMESQYADCFSEVCKQNQQLQLLRAANQEYQGRSRECEKKGSQTEQESAKTGNQLADVECELAFAKAQLSIYKTKNVELQDQLNNLKYANEFEKVLEEKDICILEKNSLILKLQKQLSISDCTASEEIANLQKCITDGATVLFEKDLQITLLQETLEELCKETEHQINLLSQQDANIGQLSISLDKANKEKETLLSKVQLLEMQQNEEKSTDVLPVATMSIATNTEEITIVSREGSVENKNKLVLQEEISELKNQLKISKDELKSWKQKYEIINTSLLTKEKNIEILKCQLENSKTNSHAHQNMSRKLQKLANQVTELRKQLEESDGQLNGLRSDCTEKEQIIATLKQELKDEVEKAEENKLIDEEKVNKAEQQVLKLHEEMIELKCNYETKEQQLETLYKEKEVEMQRLLTISCENVQGLQEVNDELMTKLKNSEEKLKKLNTELEKEQKLKYAKLEELAQARKELESFNSNSDSLTEQLANAEVEIAETRDQLSKFENELILSTEKILQLQTFLSQAQTDKQALTSQLVEIKAQMSSQSLIQQQQLAEMSARLQNAAIEKEHLERSQQRLEEMCKSLTAQVGGHKCERDRAVRGLKQAAAERSRLCQEARQVLSVARDWLSEHRASALELQKLRADRDRLLKENATYRHRRHNPNPTSILNPWGGLVDREESGFWSSHWTTQLEEVDQEIEGLRLQDEDWTGLEDRDEGGCRGDTGYQSGGSSK